MSSVAEGVTEESVGVVIVVDDLRAVDRSMGQNGHL